MKIGSILKKIGMGMVKEIPGADAVIGIVNEFLPKDKKLPETATGDDVQKAIETLHPEDRAIVLSKSIDLEIAQEEGWTERYVAMTKADGQSTRPKIAYMMAQVLSFEILAFTLWAFVYPKEMNNPVLWTVFGTLTGVPAGVLMKYFGELRKEQANRLGVDSSFFGGLVKKLTLSR